MKRSRLGLATVACFVAGLALMVPFEDTITRVLGLAFMFAFIACGVFLIADPARLAPEDDDG